jgi:hypothetical protein
MGLYSRLFFTIHRISAVSLVSLLGIMYLDLAKSHHNGMTANQAILVGGTG